jgi:hypothetical protein
VVAEQLSFSAESPFVEYGIELDLTEMWDDIRDKESTSSVYEYFKTLPMDSVGTSIREAFHGFRFTVIAVRADGKISPLGSLSYNFCNGDQGDPEQSYTFNTTFSPGHGWGLDLDLYATHCPAGSGGIKKCILTFIQYSDANTIESGKVDFDNFEGPVELSITQIFNQLEWI